MEIKENSRCVKMLLPNNKAGGGISMNIIPKQVLNLAAKYIGYKEKASNKDLYSFDGNAGKGNYTMFQAELDRAKFWNTSKNGHEWCTSFVAWCFWRLCGTEAKQILCLTGDYGASCTMWAKYYAEQARLFTKPKAGDQFFQRGSDGKPCHTGLVESVSGNTFVTIEGNYGNAVQRVTRYLGSTVYGFGRPKYTAESEDEEMERWKTIEDVPEGFYRDTVKQLMQDGIIKGKGNGVIDLTEDMLRTVIYNKRMIEKMLEK